MTCETCGVPIGTEREMTWPGDGGGEICQMCWESECSRSWWQMVNRFVRERERARVRRKIRLRRWKSCAR